MNINDEIIANPILREVKQLLETQTEKGLAKYGATVQSSNLTTEEWINHTREELMDAIIYLTTLKSKMWISELKEVVEENKRLKTFIENVGNQLCSIRGLNGTHDSAITDLCFQISETLEGIE